MSITPIEKQGSAEPAWERTVRHAVRTLRYGSVEVVVHDGRVVQVETREKVRFGAGVDCPPDDRGRGNSDNSQADRSTGASGGARAEETER